MNPCDPKDPRRVDLEKLLEPDLEILAVFSRLGKALDTIDEALQSAWMYREADNFHEFLRTAWRATMLARFGVVADIKEKHLENVTGGPGVGGSH